MAAACQILIIDGDDAHARILEHLLNDRNGTFQTYVAKSISRAEEILAERPIDLCLLDLFLEGDREYQILGDFKRKFSCLPVIAIANKNNEVLFQRSIKDGAYNFFVKAEIETLELRRAIQLAIQINRDSVKRTIPRRQHQELVSMINTIEKISNFAHFTMQLVSYEMVWAGSFYKILEVGEGTISEPTLSVYLEYVHPEDKIIVSNLVMGVSETKEEKSLDHRIIIKGKKIKWIKMTLKSAQTADKKNVYLLGSLLDMSNIMDSKSQATVNRAYKLHQDFSLDKILHHQAISLNLYRSFGEKQSTPEKQPIVDKLKQEHEVMTEFMYHSIKQNLFELTKSKLRPEPCDFIMLTNHMKNYFWMRAHNIRQDVETAIDTGNVSEIRAIYLLNFTIFVSWVSEIIESPNTHPAFIRLSGLVDSDPQDQHALVVQLKGLATPVFNDTRNSEGINRKIIKSAVEKGICEINSFKGVMETFTEELKIFIFPITSKGISYSFGPNRPIRILLAEDHFLHQIAYAKILEDLFPHQDLSLVDNGREAVTHVRQDSDYDLIILDLHMPIMNGVEAASQIRKIAPDTPIIGISDHASHQLLEEAKKAGINNFLPRPIKKRALKVMVESLMD